MEDALVARAAVLRKVGSPLTIEEIQIAPPGDGEIQVRMLAAGLCRSDLSVMQGELGSSLPVVLGHEACAIVERLGRGVEHVAVGDRVLVLFRAPCGRCRICLGGHPILCAQAAGIRRTGTLVDGTSRLRDAAGETVHHFTGVSAFAEQMVVPGEGVVKVPEELEAGAVALVGCAVLTGIGAAVNSAGASPARDAVVLGCGGVGLSVIHGCRLAGCKRIIVVDRLEANLELAAKLGATTTINAASEEWVDAVLRETDGNGCDYAFDAVGNPDLVHAALSALAPGGVVVCIGVPPQDGNLDIPALELIAGDKTIKGTLYGSWQIPFEVQDLLETLVAREINLTDMIAREIELDEINNGFRELDGGVAGRVLIRF